jgi:hypothetical protein
MLRFLRHTRAFSLATLLIFCGSVPASLWALAHDTDDDVLCQPRFVVHDESAHRFGAARSNAPDAPQQHCVVCHWLQSLHTTTPTTARLEVAVEFQHVVSAAFTFAHRIAVAQLPARAPPLA